MWSHQLNCSGLNQRVCEFCELKQNLTVDTRATADSENQIFLVAPSQRVPLIQ